VGRPGGELDDLDAALERAGGVGNGLAVLLADEACQLVPVRLEELAKARQDPGAAERRGVAPSRQRGAGRGDRLSHLGGAREGGSPDHVAGRRVEDVTGASTGALDFPATDPEGEDGNGHGTGIL